MFNDDLRLGLFVLFSPWFIPIGRICGNAEETTNQRTGHLLSFLGLEDKKKAVISTLRSQIQILLKGLSHEMDSAFDVMYG